MNFCWQPTQRDGQRNYSTNYGKIWSKNYCQQLDHSTFQIKPFENKSSLEFPSERILPNIYIYIYIYSNFQTGLMFYHRLAMFITSSALKKNVTIFKILSHHSYFLIRFNHLFQGWPMVPIVFVSGDSYWFVGIFWKKKKELRCSHQD